MVSLGFYTLMSSRRTQRSAPTPPPPQFSSYGVSAAMYNLDVASQQTATLPSLPLRIPAALAPDPDGVARSSLIARLPANSAAPPPVSDPAQSSPAVIAAQERHVRAAEAHTAAQAAIKAAQASCTPAHNSLGLPLEERLPPPPLLGVERLVAVRLRVDGAALSPPHPEAVFEDELLWNAGDTSLSPSDFAARAAEELSLPPPFAAAIAAELTAQVAAAEKARRKKPQEATHTPPPPRAAARLFVSLLRKE